MANLVTLRTHPDVLAEHLRKAGMYGTAAVFRTQSAPTKNGLYADLSGTGSTPTVALVDGTEAYTAYDPSGASSTWYRSRYENDGATRTSDWSAPTPARYG